MSMADLMTVTVPEGELDGLRVERFTVGEGTFHGFRLAMEGRGVAPGTYTRLMEGSRIWMSDTPAEKNDHMEPLWRIKNPEARRVLINGLGLGMVLAATLSYDHIEHVDVVENDKRVIDLVGPHYAADPRVTLHHADAYQQCKAWPTGAFWDVAWHDVWPTICADHLPEMARLHRSYGRRTGWQGSWGKEEAEYQRDQYQRQEARYGSFFR